MKKFFITTAIDYVNSLPHLGTAYEKIGADAIARFSRMKGDDVYFLMGNDEHAVGVKRSAEKAGLDPKKYCDQMRKKFEAIWKSVGISYDDFIQTTEGRHRLAVEVFIEHMAPGDIYKKKYEGWYCESCEAFYTEKDLVDGTCLNHKKKAEWLSEENYFFKLSKYQDRLLKLYKDHPEFILPEIRRNEVVSFVRAGLQDISISRAGVDWGIPFPNDPTHVVYVWFDALINYVSATEFWQKPKKDRVLPGWPAHLHIVGKDITRFHCVIWPAMLMSAGLPLPKTVFGHGFIFLKGEKMSKTLGNIVSPLDIVQKFGADALRYYLLRESSFGTDGDFTWENFIKRYNSDLANDLGNLLNRTLGMATKYLDGKVAKTTAAAKAPTDAAVLKATTAGVLKKLRDAIDYQSHGEIHFHRGLAAIWEAISAADKYIDTAAPWRLAKENKTAEINAVLYRIIDSIRNIAILIAPFLPATSKEIWEQLGLQKLKWEEQRFKNIGWGKTPSVKVSTGRPIFPRIDLETSEKKKELPMTIGTELEITEFQKLDLRIAEVKEAQKVEGADRLLKLQVEIGGEMRQVVAGIAQHYKPEELVGKKVVVVANLKPATIRGVESRGMILAASDATGLSVVTLDRPLPSGARVK